MKPRALWLPLCLAVLGASAPLRESVAAPKVPKVDLEDYLGDVPMQDDTKTFLTEGDDYTNTVIGVTPGPKRSVMVFEQTSSASEIHRPGARRRRPREEAPAGNGRFSTTAPTRSRS